MTAEADRLLPGRTARLNLAFDLCVLWGATLLLGWGFDAIPAGAADLGLVVGVSCLWLVLGLVLRHYDRGHRRARLEDLALTSMLVGSVVLVVSVHELVRPGGATLPALEVLVPALWAPVVAMRLLVFHPRYRAEAEDGDVVIVGAGPLARATAEMLRARNGRRIAGFVTVPGETSVTQLGGPVLGDLTDLVGLLERRAVDEVYVAENPRGEGQALETCAAICESLGLPFAVPVPTFGLARSRILDARLADDGYVHFAPDEEKPYQHAAKRLMDLCVSAIALVLLSPLLLAVAIAIKLESPGPLLFRQRRVGLHGRPFDMLKFRSMRLGSEAERARLEAKNEQDGPVFKIRDDPRVTHVGRFIRRFSIDELPQLINVLRGEMSLVGPRPPIASEVARYETWQRRRLSVRPGLTCIWQVSGRNEIAFEKWMLLDMQYIDHWSLRLDLSLLLKTIPAVLAAKGAS